MTQDPSEEGPQPEPEAPGGLRELAAIFFKLGCTAFGGPAAHIALMEDEFVSRRRWLSRQHFLDLMGATSLIPGPNSTEMALHVGYERRGWAGLFVAGLAFLLPAVALVTGIAYLYHRYGSLPAVEPVIAGIQPVVLAVILGAVWKLGKKAVTGWQTGLIGLLVAAAALAGADPVLTLFAGTILGGLFLRIAVTGGKAALFALPALSWTAAATAPQATADLGRLALFFLKVGAILYGSGYVLVVFLEDGLVKDLGWLTEQQLLDAIAVGQLTPGPVLSTAAFVGFLVAGFAGAGTAAAAIFLPSFIFVAILNPLVPKLRRSPWTARFLDAVNATAVALMAAVLIQLSAQALTGVLPWILALASAVALLRFKIAAPWLILAGAVAGGLSALLAAG